MLSISQAFIECLTAFRNELTYKQLVRYLWYVRL